MSEVTIAETLLALALALGAVLTVIGVLVRSSYDAGEEEPFCQDPHCTTGACNADQDNQCEAYG